MYKIPYYIIIIMRGEVERREGEGERRIIIIKISLILNNKNHYTNQIKIRIIKIHGVPYC